MGIRFWLGLVCALLVSSILQAGTIQYSVVPQGGNQYSYTYSLSGLDLFTGYEVDIRFNPLLYGTLSNATAGSDFDLLLLQPNNPPGAWGDYSITARVNNPQLTGPFSVDFIWLGMGMPGSQPFFINFYDQDGQHTVEQGETTLTGIPEPGTFSLAIVAFVMGGFIARRRWAGYKAQQ